MRLKEIFSSTLKEDTPTGRSILWCESRDNSEEKRSTLDTYHRSTLEYYCRSRPEYTRGVYSEQDKSSLRTLSGDFSRKNEGTSSTPQKEKLDTRHSKHPTETCYIPPDTRGESHLMTDSRTLEDQKGMRVDKKGF
jgi:hypothetical protein